VANRRFLRTAAELPHELIGRNPAIAELQAQFFRLSAILGIDIQGDITEAADRRRRVEPAAIDFERDTATPGEGDPLAGDDQPHGEIDFIADQVNLPFPFNAIGLQHAPGITSGAADDWGLILHQSIPLGLQPRCTATRNETRCPAGKRQWIDAPRKWSQDPATSERPGCTYSIAMMFMGASGTPGSGFRVPGSGFRVPGSGFRVPGSGFRVPGSGFRGRGSMVELFGG